MTRVLRWAVRCAVRSLPARLRSRVGDDLAATIDVLAAEARASGGSAKERGYLWRELRSLIHQGVTERRLEAASLMRAASPWERVRGAAGLSVRRMQRRPVAAAGTVLALCGALTVVLSTYEVATAILWRPLPFLQADRLVFLWEAAETPGTPMRVTSSRFGEWSTRTRSFTTLALFSAAGFSLDGTDGGRPIRGVRVTAGFFETLGVEPRLGRTFVAEDEEPGRDRVVILSHGTWQGRLGGRPDVIGTTLRLSGEPYAVIGVMPDVVTPGWPSNPAHVGVAPSEREFWVPMARTPARLANTRSHIYGAVARLADGVSIGQASDELARLSPEGGDLHRGLVTPFREQFVRDARTPVLVLLVAALLVLACASANLAALAMADFESRRIEVGTRTALGASRRRLGVEMWLDHAIPAAVAGALAVGATFVVLRLVPTAVPDSAPFLTAPAVSLGLSAWAFLLALGTATVMSWWPHRRVSATTLGSRGLPPSGRRVVHRALVVLQVAASVALAVPAALLARSSMTLSDRDLGFVVRDVVVADVSLPPAESSDLARVAGADRALREALAALPGVSGAALAYDHPLESNWGDVVTIDGDDAATADREHDVHLRIVSPTYFEVLGVQVLDGRSFTDADAASRPGVAMVNEAFASTLSGPILGRRLHSAAPRFTWKDQVPADFVVVGVVENERMRGVDRPGPPAVYLSTGQFPQSAATVLVRGQPGAADVASRLRQDVLRVLPTSSVGVPRRLERILRDQLAARRITADVTTIFAGAALVLTAIGLYGLLSLSMVARTREFGLRLALGASPYQLARAVMADGVSCAALGVLVGGVLSVITSRAAEHLLVEVSPHDTATLAAVGVGLLAVGLSAALGPARRAARVDPAVSLRSEV